MSFGSPIRDARPKTQDSAAGLTLPELCAQKQWQGVSGLGQLLCPVARALRRGPGPARGPRLAARAPPANHLAAPAAAPRSTHRPWTANPSAFFIRVFAASRAGRISAARIVQVGDGPPRSGRRRSGPPLQRLARPRARPQPRLPERHPARDLGERAPGRRSAASPCCCAPRSTPPWASSACGSAARRPRRCRKSLRGQCCAPLRQLAGRPAARTCSTRRPHVRLQSKAAQFQARARQASAGSSRSGKASSAPSATSTTSGPCSAWPNCARAGRRPGPSRSPCRRACSASAACCRSN